MKNSQNLRKIAQESESDFEFMSNMNKAMREERLERFSSWYPQLIKADSIISTDFSDVNKCTINTEEFGIIDYFPKANKVLIRKQNKWITAGLSWLKTNLINK